MMYDTRGNREPHVTFERVRTAPSVLTVEGRAQRRLPLLFWFSGAHGFRYELKP